MTTKAQLANGGGITPPTPAAAAAAAATDAAAASLAAAGPAPPPSAAAAPRSLVQHHPAPPLSAAAAAAGPSGSADGAFKSRFRGVSFDKKKRKWRVQIKVACLGKSGVSVGYYETEEAAARAYDRAAIGLLGRDSAHCTTNFPLSEYADAPVPHLVGKSREEVKATLKSERARAPRRRFCSRARTSRFMGVGSSNRRNQWQARILVHGKVTHLGYYEAEGKRKEVFFFLEKKGFLLNTKEKRKRKKTHLFFPSLSKKKKKKKKKKNNFF